MDKLLFKIEIERVLKENDYELIDLPTIKGLEYLDTLIMYKKNKKILSYRFLTKVDGFYVGIMDKDKNPFIEDADEFNVVLPFNEKGLSKFREIVKRIA